MYRPAHYTLLMSWISQHRGNRVDLEILQRKSRREFPELVLLNSVRKVITMRARAKIINKLNKIAAIRGLPTARSIKVYYRFQWEA